MQAVSLEIIFLDHGDASIGFQEGLKRLFIYRISLEFIDDIDDILLIGEVDLFDSIEIQSFDSVNKLFSFVPWVFAGDFDDFFLDDGNYFILINFE